MLSVRSLATIAVFASSSCAHHAVVDDGTSVSFGNPREGILVNASRLPTRGVGYYSPSRWEQRGLRYGTDEMVSMVVWIGRELDRIHPKAAFAVADISLRAGGPSAWHRSHQHGRDIDIPFITRTKAGGMRAVQTMRHFAGSGEVVARGGAPIAPEPDIYFDVARNWTLVKLLLTNPIAEIQYIFVSDDLKQTLIDHATAEGEPADVIGQASYLLAQPSDSAAHDDHFHIRIYCQVSDLKLGCRDWGTVRWLKKVYKYERPVRRSGFSTLLAYINQTSGAHGHPRRIAGARVRSRALARFIVRLMAEQLVKSVKLFFQEQPSDKVYNVALVESDGSYTVRVEWGRRGANLNKGTKAVDVELAAAEKAYAKVVKQKTRKGYEILTEENKPAEVAPPVGEGSASKVAGSQRERLAQRAQLLNAVDPSAVDGLIGDGDIVAQQKLDGMRVLLHMVEGAVVATNREGQITSISEHVAVAFRGAPDGSIFDGELVSGQKPSYWLFDLISYGDEDLREAGYVERYERLTAIGVETDEVTVVPTATSEDEKRRLYAALEAQNAEGIVFKRGDAPYTMGRPASGGTQLKLKFVKTADVVITENAGNAYRMAVYDGDELRACGKVFAGTTNESRAELDRLLSDGVNPVAEVKYLYATDDLILFQPVFVRLRDDKEASACVLAQLVQTDRSGLAEI